MAHPLAFFSRLGTGARLLFASAVLGILGISGLLLWRAWHPQYERLQLQLEAGDTARIAETLDAAAIPFRIDTDNRGVLVPANQVAEARARLAVNGFPGGTRVGFETFDQSSLGTTDFAQRINFLRALQGELERTVEHLLGSEGVRVHLTLPVSRGLLAEKRQAKAAVLVPLRTLAADQVRAVQGLVAGAVEGLDPTEVSVAASDGRLLSSALGPDGQPAQADAAGALKLKEEERIRTRVLEVLSPFAAADSIRVAVAVELDLDDVELSRESAVPAAGGRRPEAQPASEREQRRVRPGRIAAVSLAVTVPSSDLLPAEADLARLVAAAAGIREDRGDRLEVLRVTLPAPPPAPSAPAQTTTVEAPSVPVTLPPQPELASPHWTRLLGESPLWLWPSVLLVLLCATGWLAFRLGRRRAVPVAPVEHLARVQAWLQQDLTRRLT